ncbi:hypothetical protein ACFWZ1_05935 [Frateuria sp. GZRe14]|jgi:uncharacterized membrane protein|uniref:hypothetical protein n=1 Tax=Frateuria sp. GZRe14 TaxID=3351534 RepID=UPI003EDBBA2A
MNMELDEMKLAWQQLNRRMDQQQALNVQLYREGRLDKLRHGLRPLVWGQSIQLVFGVFFMLLGTAYWTSHLDVLHQIALGVMVQVFGIAMVAFAARILHLVLEIDYTAPVLDIQRRLVQLRAWRVRVEAPVFAVVGSFVWIPLFLMEIHWEIGVDVWGRWPGFVGWLVICGGVSLALVLLVVLLAHGTGRMHWITDNAAGKAVRRAEAALEEIARFEQAT